MLVTGNDNGSGWGSCDGGRDDGWLAVCHRRPSQYFFGGVPILLLVGLRHAKLFIHFILPMFTRIAIGRRLSAATAAIGEQRLD